MATHLTGTKKEPLTLLLVLLAGIVAGTMLALYLPGSQDVINDKVAEEQLAGIAASLSRLEATLTDLGQDVRQMQVTILADRTATSGFRMEQLPDVESITAKGDMPAAVTPDAGATAAEAPTEAEEMLIVATIVDKLRAQDIYSYPDFPALMTAPEMSELSQQAKDQVLAEIADLVESGQIDPSFFPGR